MLLFFSWLMLFSEPEFSRNIERLSQTSQWKNMLHFRHNQSEIDDEQFFFSKDGKTDAKAELMASIKQLIFDKSDDENSTLCRYPARSYWILKHFPKVKKKHLYPSVEL